MRAPLMVNFFMKQTICPHSPPTMDPPADPAKCADCSENWYQGTWEFWDIGRRKAKTTVNAKEPEDFLRAVRPHLMSQDIGFDYDTESNEGTVTAGLRHVGKFKRAEGV